MTVLACLKDDLTVSEWEMLNFRNEYEIKTFGPLVIINAVFDITILEAWFNTVGVRCPWKFWNVRDVRTAVDLLGINPKEFTRDGTFHNALDDCLHQIKYLTSGMTQ